MRTVLLLFVIAVVCLQFSCAKHYVNYPVTTQANDNIRVFIDEMTAKHGFEKRYLYDLFQSAAPFGTVTSAVADMSRPVEAFNWAVYRNKMVNDLRTNQGVEYYYANRETFERAERLYGVPSHIIVGIMGIETNYGKVTMRYKALDALITFSFINTRRGAYFKTELESLLLLSQSNAVNPKEFRSSYAGAIGIPQFMPSNVNRYGVDGDGDGVIDIINNHADAIFSAANYLNKNGWLRNRPAAVRVKVKNMKKVEPFIREAACSGEFNTVNGLRSVGVIFPNIPLYKNDAARLLKVSIGDGKYEYHVAFENICVIMKYNQSFKYAMAVNYLADNVAERGGLTKQVSVSKPKTR